MPQKKHELSPEITVLQEISYAVVHHQRNVDDLLNEILAVLDRRMGMLRGTITLLHGDTLKIEASHGLDESGMQRGLYHLGEGITGRVAQTGRPELVPDIAKDARFLNRTRTRKYDHPVAFICVPVYHMERVIGTLSIDRRIESETDLERDMALLETIGNIVADAVEVCRREHEEREDLLEENRKLRKMLNENPGELIGNCRTMQNIYGLIRQVAPSDATVLIRGGSGTGKELVARAIVQLSGRSAKPFVALNCAALPENLVESELFGHEKGAFTGATSRRIGRAEAADGGTLFLDEIGDLTLQTQVKLLRFIQERTFSRIGSNQELKSNVRFLAATSRNLEELMRQKKFREDLYYRLNIFPIVMPDLCKRRCDIILLAEHFIEKLNVRYGKHVKRLSTPAINMLMSYHWPGNVRELENCIERAVLTATDDCIHGYNLPPSLQTGKESGSDLLPEGKASFNTLVDSYERELIVEALKRNLGNMSAAARDLDLSPRVIHYKIGRLGITPEWYQQQEHSDGDFAG
ncbi:sigma 54-interacting transcriptional regulator [Victivallis vadensis]|uniref:Sigma 54-interacting transcriptional regulator n=1 Tax=Victivallis vadensis TaxID=172901 RepID=A0A848AWR3_9BACT|nr:sigma 54-interacting transcriptional regulator [Victivallis vadensis]NMD87945.1 sigma 54-interacting transcriptional regulator [Victivallis vadensis]